MTYKNTHLEDLLDSTVSGYWGEDYATTKSRNLCQVIRNGDVGKNGCIDQNDLPRRWFSNSELAKALVRKGDSILVSSGAYTGNVGRLSDSSKNRLPVIASNFVRRLRSKEGVRPDWLYHLLRSGDIQAQVPAYVGGSAMPNLQPDFYKYCRVPVCPSPQVQDIIIRIINSIDSTIDQAETLLAKQQRIKTGLIHDLLTRGLDAQGRLRDPSNYPIVSTRVGNIPAEWNLSTVGEECYQVCVGIVIRPTQYYSETGPIALRSLNVQRGYFDLSNVVRISHEANRVLSKSRLKAGDVVTVRTGEPGTSSVVTDELEGSNCIDLVISRPGSRLLAGFLALWMNSTFGKGHVLKNQGGLAQQHFNVGDMKLLPIPIPSLDEQNEIIVRGNVINANCDKIQEAIFKLTHLKYGLMHDLLTGRIPITPLLTATNMRDS